MGYFDLAKRVGNNPNIDCLLPHLDPPRLLCIVRRYVIFVNA